MPIIHQGKTLTSDILKNTKSVEIKPNPSVVTAIKKDGTIVKNYPYKFYINGKEMKMDDELQKNINNIIKTL